MAKNTTPYLLQNDVYTRQTFVNADGTTEKIICSAGTEGSYLYMINISADINAARDMVLVIHDGTNSTPIKFLTVGINQGNTIASPDPIRLLQADANFIVGRLLDRDQNYYIPLPAGFSIRARMISAVPSGQTIVVNTHRKDF
jgi:hypothetical protein